MSQPVAAELTRASFVVDDRLRGMRQTYDNRSRLRATLAHHSGAQMIRDTLEAESHRGQPAGCSGTPEGQT